MNGINLMCCQMHKASLILFNGVPLRTRRALVPYTLQSVPEKNRTLKQWNAATSFGMYDYTLLKSDVTRRDHVVRCRGSQGCWFTLCQFRCQFHSRWQSSHNSEIYNIVVHAQ